MLLSVCDDIRDCGSGSGGGEGANAPCKGIHVGHLPAAAASAGDERQVL